MIMINQTDQAFWIVWCPHGEKPPTYRHVSMEAATEEAERLARANPGRIFVVMESVAARCVDNMTRTEYTGGSLPF